MVEQTFTGEEMLSAITACVRAERVRSRVRPALKEQARSYERMKAAGILPALDKEDSDD